MNSKPFEKATSLIAARLQGTRPKHAMVTGSGWAHALDGFRQRCDIPYSQIPGLGSTTVQGHDGRLLLVEAAGVPVLVFAGRRHWYEGLGWNPVALPVHVCKALGVQTLVLTNAAGALNPAWQPGDLMLIRDHINLMGTNPLIGPHNAAWGARFPDMTGVYTDDLCKALHQAAHIAHVTLHEGVYIAVSGPTYETPAETRMLRALGGDAVGMSTVPEAILAHAAGLSVAAISCIANAAAGAHPSTLSHEDVVSATQRAMPRMTHLLTAFFSACGKPRQAG